MYCLFQSSERPLDDLDEVEKFVEKTITTEKVDIDKDMKAMLCGAIRNIWLFCEQKPTDSPRLRLLRQNGKSFFYYTDLENKRISGNFVRLRLLLEKQYKIRIEKAGPEPFRSTGFLITNNNQDLIKILSYLFSIIECEKIIDEKAKQDIIIQEFVEKKMVSVDPLFFTLIVRRAVHTFFKNSEIKTEEQMANLQKTIEVKIEKSKKQRETIKIKISAPPERFFSKAILRWKGNYCGIEFFKKINIEEKKKGEKKDEVWFVCDSDKNFKKIKNREEFKEEMEKETNSNENDEKSIPEKNSKNQNDVNKETNEVTDLDKKKETLEKKTKRSPMKLVIIIMILLTILFCVLSFVVKYYII